MQSLKLSTQWEYCSIHVLFCHLPHSHSGLMQRWWATGLMVAIFFVDVLYFAASDSTLDAVIKVFLLFDVLKLALPCKPLVCFVSCFQLHISLHAWLLHSKIHPVLCQLDAFNVREQYRMFCLIGKWRANRLLWTIMNCEHSLCATVHAALFPMNPQIWIWQEWPTPPWTMITAT